MQTSNNEENRKRQNRKSLLAILITVLLMVTFFLGYFVCFFARSEESRKFDEIKNFIDKQGINVENLSADEIAKEMLNILLKNDRYAEYYTAEEYAEVTKNNAGNYTGYGFSVDNGGVIVRVYWNSPAHISGLKEGDVLKGGKKDGEEQVVYFAPTENKTFSDNMTEFFATVEDGEEISLICLREEEEKEIKVKRQAYILSYVLYADSEKGYEFKTEDGEFKGVETENGMIGLSDNIAYIRLTAFEGGAAWQFGKAMEYMKSRERTKLILDLRNNGGGLLNVLTDIASYLINDNGKESILVTNVEEKSRNSQYYTSRNNFNEGLKTICVLANYNTASASESLIGALIAYGNSQVYNGAEFNYNNLIITAKHPVRETYSTYGKGIMQTTYLLKSGGALKLTTAKLFWPAGYSSTCIQDVGIIQENPLNQVSDKNAVNRAIEILSAYSEQSDI